jgi:hypothetical protein
VSLEIERHGVVAAVTLGDEAWSFGDAQPHALNVDVRVRFIDGEATFSVPPEAQPEVGDPVTVTAVFFPVNP